jgi:hypothetical protein
VSRTLIVIVLILLGLGGLSFALRPAPNISNDATSTELSADEARERVYDVQIRTVQ